MGCYAEIKLVSLVISLLMVFPMAFSEKELPLKLTHHGGRLLTGKLNLGIVWYGQIPRGQKKTILSFIRSLNGPDSATEPTVSKWWSIVTSYNAEKPEAGARPNKIPVKVVNQVADPNYSFGKALIKDFFLKLATQAAAGKPNTVALIIATKGVVVQDMCAGLCAQHGFNEADNQTYVALGNPEDECPVCAWPYETSQGKVGEVKPPNGNIGADAMVNLLASGLAGLVTNPFGDGFFARIDVDHTVEITTNCPDIFAKGKIPVDAATGASYNVVGEKGKKFLLPALWDPATSSCWTPV